MLENTLSRSSFGKGSHFSFNQLYWLFTMFDLIVLVISVIAIQVIKYAICCLVITITAIFVVREMIFNIASIFVKM